MKGNVSAQNSTSKFEWMVNIAIILIAGYFLVTLGRTILQWSRTPVQVESAKVGARLTLPDVAWTGDGETLVMALSTSCHFCSESAPFYQKLLQNLAGREGMRVIAILPQSVEEGHEYLRGLGVTVDEVLQVNLSTLGLEGTPTLMLADGAGTIKSLRTGKLTSTQERELFRQLQLDDGAAPEDDLVSASDLKKMMSDKNLVVVDVDNRDLFRANHVSGAVNIPLDELEVRAVNELRPENKLAVYCHICSQDEESGTARELLLKSGFNQVLVLKGGLKAWESENPRKDSADHSSGADVKKRAASGR